MECVPLFLHYLLFGPVGLSTVLIQEYVSLSPFLGCGFYSCPECYRIDKRGEDYPMYGLKCTFHFFVRPL